MKHGEQERGEAQEGGRDVLAWVVTLAGLGLVALGLWAWDTRSVLPWDGHGVVWRTVAACGGLMAFWGALWASPGWGCAKAGLKMGMVGLCGLGAVALAAWGCLEMAQPDAPAWPWEAAGLLGALALGAMWCDE